MNRRWISIFSCFFVVSGLAVSSSQKQQVSLSKEMKTILKQNCSVSGCHAGKYPAMNLNFEPEKFFQTALNTPSQEKPPLKIVDTQNPEQSYLLMKIRGDAGIGGKRMPLNRDPLKAEAIQQVESWLMSLKETFLTDTIASNQVFPTTSPEEEMPTANANSAEAKKPPLTKPPFWGTRLVNLPTTITPSKGEFLFRISHRFQLPVSSGYDNFFGFDGPAFVLISFGYGINNHLMLTLGRTKLFQETELSLAWFFLERKQELPLEATLHIGGSLATQKRADRSVFSSKNFKLNAQLSLSYQATNRISLLLVPSFSSNTNHWETDSKGTLGLGIGGRWMFLEDLSLIAEWVPTLSGYKDANGSWGFGVEKKIGGHVFQFFITNSIGILPSQYLPGGDLKLGDGDFRIGFNIFRSF